MKQKFIFLTGGAKRIGKTTCQHFHNEGFNIIFHYNSSESEANEIKKNLNEIINIILDNNIQVILAGMVASPTNGLSYKKEFDKIYPDLSKKFELELIPFLLKGVALNPNFNQDDGLHPNEKGVLIIAETIKRSITDLTKK